jgi:hypothetical protein
MTFDLQERCSAAKAQGLAEPAPVLGEFVAVCVCLIEALQFGMPNSKRHEMSSGVREGIVIRFDLRDGVGLVTPDDGYQLTFCARYIRDHPAAEKLKAWQLIAFQRGKVRIGQLRACGLQRVG